MHKDSRNKIKFRLNTEEDGKKLFLNRKRANEKEILLDSTGLDTNDIRIIRIKIIRTIVRNNSTLYVNSAI